MMTRVPRPERSQSKRVLAGKLEAETGNRTEVPWKESVMALKNLEEAIVERIHRAVAKELKRLRRASRATNGHTPKAPLTRKALHGDGGDRQRVDESASVITGTSRFVPSSH